MPERNPTDIQIHIQFTRIIINTTLVFNNSAILFLIFPVHGAKCIVQVLRAMRCHLSIVTH